MSRDGSSDESPAEEDGGDTGESLCQGEDNFKDIAVYFSKKQWVQLREWEKVRFKNVKQNYETMLKIGLRIPPPTFMSHGRQNKTAKVEESGDSDEEWTPQQLMKNLRFPSKGKQKTHLRNKEMAKEPVKPKAEGMMDLSEELKMVVMNKLAISKVMKQMDQMDEICTTNQLTEEKMVADSIPECRRKEVEVHMYNLRERKYKMYQETWDPQDDDYLFCEECQTFFLETCAVHGPPKFAHDSAMIKGHPYCSAITLPPGLRIGLSGIPGAGLGVWNEASDLPLGLHFGPYEGQTTEDDEAANSGYSWMVTKGRNSYEYVDGKEESCSNWMRYVNCARDEEEQNLVAFQYHRQIFYRTCRVIRPGCELLVWYGDEYGQELGIKWGSKWKRPLTALTGESPGIHLCPACPLDFSTPAVLNQHMLLHHPSQGTRNNYGMGERQPDQQLPLPGDGYGSNKAETSQKGSLLGKTKQVDLEELPSLCQSQQVGEKESYSGEWDFSGIQGKSTKHTTQTFQEGDKKWFGTYKYGKYLQGFSSKSVITRRQTHSREKPHMCEECGRRFTEKSGLTRHRQTHSGEKPHVCEECGQGFTSKSALITHGQTHTREKPFICEVCEGGFTNKSALIAHGRTHSKEKPYVCEVCEEGFTNKSVLIAHRRIHAREKPYVCGVCGQRFKSKSALIGHSRTHSEGKPFVCEVCGQRFTYKSYLIVHSQTHLGEKPYICKECEQGFTNKPALIAHSRIHSGEKPYVCEECGGGFTYKSYLIIHRRTHSGEKPHVCEECGRGFIQRSDLKRHWWTHSGKKPYACEECGRGYTRQSVLNKHRWTHSKEKPFMCEECKQEFTQKSALIIHRQTHLEGKPYACDKYSQGFTYQSALITHKWTHSGEKPHVCEECGRGFTYKSVLITHRRGHSGEKPYTCEECGRGFTYKSYLTVHKQIHLGEKPHVCEECGQGFIQRSDLKRHRCIHSGEKPYVCEECGRGFARKSILKRHRWTHSREKPSSCEECKQGLTELRPQEPQVNTLQERSFMFVRNVGEDLCTRQPLSHTGGHTQERSFIIVRVGEDLYTSQSFSYIGGHTQERSFIVVKNLNNSHTSPDTGGNTQERSPSCV